MARTNKEQRSIRELVRIIVNSTLFNFFIALLIILSFFLILGEFLLVPSLYRDEIIIASDFITYVFVFELILRFYAAPNKKIFFGNYWIDIFAVLPVLRIFRTLRLLRLLRILRMGRAIIIILRQSGWLSRSIEKSFGNFSALFLTSVLLILCGTFGLLSVEPPPIDVNNQELLYENFSKKAWLSAFMFINGEITDGLPVSLEGKFIAMLISTSGLVVFALLVGTISVSMTNFIKSKIDSRDMEIQDLKNHLIICGWDRMGNIILHELEAVEEVWRNGVVIVAETDDDILKTSNLKNSSRLFHIKDDFTRIDILKKAGALNAKTAIVLADKGKNLGDQDRDARTVLAALTLEKLNPQIYTCCELLNSENSTHLSIAGVEEIISRTNITAGLFAATAIHGGLTTVISDILTHREGSYFKKISAPKELIGKKFIEALNYLKANNNATILAIDSVNENGKYIQHVNPSNDYIIKNKDKLVAIVNKESRF